jgi:copper ion binding protein
MTKKIKIEGMSCEHCVMHITNALKEIAGVNHVKVSLADKTADVDLNNTVTNNELINAIVAVGYDVVGIE